MLAEYHLGMGGGACLPGKRFPGKVNPMLFQEVLPALGSSLGTCWAETSLDKPLPSILGGGLSLPGLLRTSPRPPSILSLM